MDTNNHEPKITGDFEIIDIMEQTGRIEAEEASYMRSYLRALMN